MDSTFKAQWVDALRSGNFTQGRGTLARVEATGTSYCCLGVACKLLEDAGEFTSRLHSTFTYFEYDGQADSAGLTSSMLEKLDLSYTEQEKLINMNDGSRASFAEIANWIEDNL